jgi:non-heme chloroperoxidase
MGDGMTVLAGGLRRAGTSLLLATLLLCGPALAQAASHRQFTTSDGVRLHYLEAGPADAPPILFVPGWTMPAWIWDGQLDALSDRYHVIAFDPRGQGASQIAASGYDPDRRGRDIGELISARLDRPVVIVGWSLGVLDTLSYLMTSGDARVAGLVLVDNSIGEGPPPTQGRGAPSVRSAPDRARARAAFVKGLFARDPGEAFRTRLTSDSLKTPPDAEQALLRYPVPREAWRKAVHGTQIPVLYIVRPRLRGQGEALIASRPNSRMEVFEKAGHALFVDEPGRFNALIDGFMIRDVQARRP